MRYKVVEIRDLGYSGKLCGEDW